MIKTCISKDWHFRSPTSNNTFSSDSSRYQAIDLPHDYAITAKRSPEGNGTTGNGFFPDTWGRYVKYLTLDTKRHYTLNLDGAYMCSQIFLNENHLALHPYGYTPFLVELTPYVLPEISNKLVITTNPLPCTSRWYSGNGLFRDVFLWEGGDIRIEPWDLFVSTRSANAEEAQLRLKLRITANKTADITVKFTLESQEESFSLSVQDGEKKEAEYTLSVKNPRLWFVDDPQLYMLKTEILEGDTLHDTTETEFGIRTISADVENGLLLNGKFIKLRGGCIHHDHGVLGAAAFPAAETRKIRLLKEAGFNAIRTAHNPPSLALLEACDRMGMIVMDEAFDLWNKRKYENDYHLFFQDWWARDISYMVQRERNHPCVLCYSIGNEVLETDGTSGAGQLAQQLVDEVRKYDDTRFVTAGIVKGFARFPYTRFPQIEDIDPDDYQAYFTKRFSIWEPEELNRATKSLEDPLDIVGLNYYYKYYLLDHQQYPNRVMWGSETKALDFYDSWNVTAAHNFILGDFTWTAYDNLGETGGGRSWWARQGQAGGVDHQNKNIATTRGYPWRTCYQGDLDLCGYRRPQSFFREAIWIGNQPPRIFVTHPEHFGEEHFGTGWHWADVKECWTYPDRYIGHPIQVETYTDAEKILWYVNEVFVGESIPEKGIATLHTTYQPGCITAVAYKQDAEVSRFTLPTTDAPSAIQVTPEQQNFLADNRDLCYFDIMVTDRQGRWIADAEQEIACTVSGGELIGIFSGNPYNEDQYGSNRCHVFNGKALAIVRTKTPGTVKIHVYAQALASGYAEVTAL